MTDSDPELEREYEEIFRLQGQGQHDQAIELCKRLLERAQAASDGENEQSARAHLNLGMLHVQSGNPGLSEHFANKALELFRTLTGPTSLGYGLAHLCLGRVRMAQGRFDEAETALVESVDVLEQNLPEAEPHLPACRNDLETLRREKGQAPEGAKIMSVDALEKMIQKQMKGQPTYRIVTPDDPDPT